MSARESTYKVQVPEDIIFLFLRVPCDVVSLQRTLKKRFDTSTTAHSASRNPKAPFKIACRRRDWPNGRAGGFDVSTLEAGVGNCVGTRSDKPRFRRRPGGQGAADGRRPTL